MHMHHHQSLDAECQIQLQRTVVGSAGDQRVAHTRAVQNGQYLVGSEDCPIRLAIVDVGVEDGEILGTAGGGTAPKQSGQKQQNHRATATPRTISRPMGSGGGETTAHRI
jgi:hypothetical protein